MKKAMLIFIAATLLSSCVSKRELIGTTGSDCTGTPSSATVLGSRLWITFIPIGLGPRKYENRKDKAIARFLKHNNCTGIANGKIVDKRVIIPLIVINYSVKWTKVSGTPCGVKK